MNTNDIDKDFLKKIVSAIQDLLSQKITADKFQDIYFDAYLNYKGPMSESFYNVLEQLFGDTECYSDMPLAHGENPNFYVTEEQLRKSTQEALDKLKKLG
jgi:hypothetical protein